jgi:hypothetical protein
MAINYYFNDKKPVVMGQKELYPFTHKCPANKGSSPPLNATRTAPSEPFPQGYWPGWDSVNDQWAYMEDHRGEKGYIGKESFEVKELGPLPDDFSTTPPPPTAEELRAEQISQYESELNQIDFKSTRAIRSISILMAVENVPKDGTADASELYLDAAKLRDFENQAKQVRAKLKKLLEVNNGTA